VAREGGGSSAADRLHDRDSYWADCCVLVPSCKRGSVLQGAEVARIRADRRRPPQPWIYT
jgi:hypothetical protein